MAAPKLRDSCNVCALSKIKCTKEKPACLRCAKRGLRCEYLATRRTGRKHDSRRKQPDDSINTTENSGKSGEYDKEAPINDDLSTTNTDNTNSVGLAAVPGSRHSPSNSEYSNYLAPNNSLSLTQPFVSEDRRDPFGSSLYPPPLNSNPRIPNFNFEDFLSSPLPSDFVDIINGGMSTLPNDGLISSTSNIQNSSISSGSGSFFPKDMLSMISDETLSPPSAGTFSPNTGITDSVSTASTADSISLQRTCSDSPNSCCLVKALTLIKQLSPNAATVCTTAEASDDEPMREPQSIQVIIAENEQTSDQVSKMLQCPCSQDPYLLHMLSLIVFQVMGWYAAAASKTLQGSGGTENSTPRRSSSLDPSVHTELVLNSSGPQAAPIIDDEDQSRLATQLVLSELYRVQRLVNVLSQRLKALGKDKQNRLSNPPSSVSKQQEVNSSDLSESIPFSPKTLEQLECDLRKRLRGLSLEIVGMLRRD